MKYISNNLLATQQTVLILLVSCMALMTGCKKWAEVDTPVTYTSTDNVYKDPSKASAAFIGIYTRLTQNSALVSLSVYAEVSADNLSLVDINNARQYLNYYQNNLDPRYTNAGEPYWKTLYNLLYTVNDAIPKLEGNTYLPLRVSTRLLGEAYFLRAFFYFYLTNLYGDVPLVLTTNPELNAKITRSPSGEVYTQMINDLAKAEELLTADYVGANAIDIINERVRPNLAAVNALQARVFLYSKNYAAAETAATKVIGRTQYALTAPANVFTKNSAETIWGLPSVSISTNTFSGRYLFMPATGPNGDYNFTAAAALVDSFEPGDQRRTDWFVTVTKMDIPYVSVRKYKVPNIPGSTDINEYDIVLRLAEQYLIRAEARNEQGNTAGSVADINALRAHRRAAVSAEIPAPLPDLANTLTQTALRPLILQERRVELFTEWGHRWFDLRRSGTIDDVMKVAASLKGGTWSSFKSLYPVPASDIFLNGGISQNTGYIN